MTILTSPKDTIMMQTRALISLISEKISNIKQIWETKCFSIYISNNVKKGEKILKKENKVKVK